MRHTRVIGARLQLSPLDFLNDVPGAETYDEVRSRARQVNAAGVTVWVVGYEDLIRMKEPPVANKTCYKHQLCALVNDDEAGRKKFD